MTTIYGTSGDDRWDPEYFNSGIDYTFYGFEGNDVIFGNDGNDRLNGGTGNDYLVGDAGDDILNGGSGADVMMGGAGNDTYYVDNSGDDIREYSTIIDQGTEYYVPEDPDHPDIDTVYASISFTLPENVEVLRLVAGAGAIYGAGNELDNRIYGNESENRLEGRDGDDVLNGGGGDDWLLGGRGDDVLDGGTGADDMRGSIGNDYYYVDSIYDSVIEDAGEGHDTVYSSVSHTLGPNVEDLVLIGTGAIDGTGNGLDNTVIGNGSDNELRGLDGADLLKGGGGDDTLRGGNQNDELYGQGGDDVLRGDGGDDEMYGGTDDDTYFVNSAGDLVVENSGEGHDTVFVFGLTNYTLTANVEDLALITGDNGTGNGLNNTITGNSLDNIIDGRGGADTMEGRGGNDTYFVDNARDVVVEASGEGNDTVLTSVSYTLGAGAEVETLRTTKDIGTAAINLTGNAFNNTLIGNDGANVLSGGGSSDVLDGRGGIDTASYENNSSHVVVVLGQNGAPGLAYEFAFIPGSGEQIVSVDTLISIENVRGSAFGDTLVGNEQINRLSGLNGNDIYVVQNAGDVVIEVAGQGLDEVRTSVSYTLGATADIETFRTTDDAGTAAIDLTGNDIANTIFGNAGDNVIRGGGGADHLFGGRGVDSLVGGSQADIFVWSNTNETGTEANFADAIADFNFADGDRIDLSQIDANLVSAGNQAFSFIGQNDFTLNAATSDPSDVVPGEIRYVHANGDTLILLQTGTSPDAEAVIRIAGTVTPEASWFVL
jgi:Ca2+-binding RTX toxin-like protein